MITGMEIAACQHMAVPAEVMQHIVNVESGYNPFAIGVVGAQLVRQPQSIGEAVATVRMLESRGYNFSVGLSQVNRANFGKYGLTSYEQAFEVCPNLTAGARILSDCYASSGNDWGKSFSCYYSGNFVTGYRDGYVQKVYDSINAVDPNAHEAAISKPIQLASTAPPSRLRSAPTSRSFLALAADNAGYRMAIRSTALSETETSAVNSDDPALAQATVADTGLTNQAPNKADVPQRHYADASSTTPPAPSPAASTPDVFEPKITFLGQSQGEPAAVASPRRPNNINTTSPGTSPSDRTNPDQEARDDAFVF